MSHRFIMLVVAAALLPSGGCAVVTVGSAVVGVGGAVVGMAVDAVSLGARAGIAAGEAVVDGVTAIVP